MMHSKLGITALIAAMGAVGLMLRWLLHRVLITQAWIIAPKNMRERVLFRYQGKDFHAWMFARCKTHLDAMFDELPHFLQQVPDLGTFLDLGCGYGIAGCFLLEHFKHATAYAVDPNMRRVDSAAAAMGDRGRVFEGAAPNFLRPEFPEKFDAVFALDVIQYLSDEELDLTLKRIRRRLSRGDSLFIRSPVRPVAPKAFHLMLCKLSEMLQGNSAVFRTVEQLNQQISRAGFDIKRVQLTASKRDLFWFVATASAVQLMPEMNTKGYSDHHQNDDHVDHDQTSEVQAGELVPLLQKAQPA